MLKIFLIFSKKTKTKVTITYREAKRYENKKQA
jgi:hypothetical protein